MSTRFFSALLLLLFTLTATAADIAREIHSPSSGSAAFAELGIVLSTEKLPLLGFNGQELDKVDDTIQSLGIGLMGRLEYKGFFAEFIENSFSNATLGTTVWSDDNSELEVIFSTLFGQISRKEFSGYETIKNRKGDLNAGFRGSYYFSDRILQFELVHDIVNSHNGWMGSLQLGKQLQLRNWNIHGLVGVRYFSKDIADHLFGVSADEATADLPQYTAGDAFVPSIQAGAAIPLNEKWIFRTSADYSWLPGSVTNSPLAQGDAIWTARAGVYYVFGG